MTSYKLTSQTGMQSSEEGFEQIIGRIVVTIKNGNQQTVNAPTIIPRVLVAFTFLLRSRDVAIDTRRRILSSIVVLTTVDIASIYDDVIDARTHLREYIFELI